MRTHSKSKLTAGEDELEVSKTLSHSQAFRQLQNVSTQRKAWEISSYAVMSGRQRVDISDHYNSNFAFIHLECSTNLQTVSNYQPLQSLYNTQIMQNTFVTKPGSCCVYSQIRQNAFRVRLGFSPDHRSDSTYWVAKGYYNKAFSSTRQYL